MKLLTEASMFTLFANRHGVKVIAATPIGEHLWSIIAVRVKTVCGKQVSEYIAWEWSEDTKNAYNGCYFMQNADEYSDETAFNKAWLTHTERVMRGIVYMKGEARTTALTFIEETTEVSDGQEVQG